MIFINIIIYIILYIIYVYLIQFRLYFSGSKVHHGVDFVGDQGVSQRFVRPQRSPHGLTAELPATHRPSQRQSSEQKQWAQGSSGSSLKEFGK